MAIVQTIDTVYAFEQAFNAAGRRDQFSYEGLKVLFDYLEEYSEGTGGHVELDVVALCCEYYESSIQEIVDNYSIDVSDAEGDEDEIQEIVEEYLQKNTSVCGKTNDGFVYAAF